MIDVQNDQCGTHRVARITVGDGRRHNVLRTADWRTLGDLVESLPTHDVSVVVVTGGGGSFCAGSDLREWSGAPPRQVDASFAAMERAFRAIEALPVPVVAVVRGVATGGGCQLALACDLQVAATDARIGMPIARLGVFASTAFAARIVARSSAGLARDLLLTGRLLDGREAAQLGVVSRCADADQLDRLAGSLVRELCDGPREALAAAKAAVRSAEALLAGDRTPPVGPVADYARLQHAVTMFLARP